MDKEDAYYAFNPSGTRILAGPFDTRIEAARLSNKAGKACRYCKKFSGGMSICWSCLCVILSPRRKRRKRRLKTQNA